ncbi:phosphoglucosamine mutase [Actinocatenispora comari]|uniref:Phosphoglucosamine mutase n=1 Tax=Actinocatenispora comari TaxID=2807577 RepID=A0A8J4ACU6_9ACTN|nr:phosphoglucosamine mutase [Actinocatenispora comari]GIL26792.1 phosphoglucosamine mutase [Actinocatenispora comari]
MGRLFGTDGVRGLANAELTPELAVAVAVSAAHVLAPVPDESTGHRPVAVVGRDPRASGDMLEAAVVAGLCSAGTDVLRVGVLPTPAVAHLVAETGAAFGVVLSASHNPMPDNGIKLFAAGGQKLPDDVEDAIERLVAAPDGWRRPRGAAIGRAVDHAAGAERYLEHLLGSLPHRLDGVKVVVDCANGAASAVSPEAYRRAGAEVIAIHAEPNGLNINADCGSTHLETLIAAVAEHGANLGIAHDGDADRCLAVTADGTPVDGDQIMGILALAMRESGTLTDDVLVVTVMSNLGLHLAMREHGIEVATTAVGDRYVLELLRSRGLALGGEQSGHVVLPQHATTGDGTLTALQLMARMAATGTSLAELAAVVRPLPQVLLNVRVADKAAAADTVVRDSVASAERELGDSGRVLLRPSGTEPLIRVMVEAATQPQAAETAEKIAAAVRAASPL